MHGLLHPYSRVPSVSSTGTDTVIWKLSIRAGLGTLSAVMSTRVPGVTIPFFFRYATA